MTEKNDFFKEGIHAFLSTWLTWKLWTDSNNLRSTCRLSDMGNIKRI